MRRTLTVVIFQASFLECPLMVYLWKSWVMKELSSIIKHLALNRHSFAICLASDSHSAENQWKILVGTPHPPCNAAAGISSWWCHFPTCQGCLKRKPLGRDFGPKPPPALHTWKQIQTIVHCKRRRTFFLPQCARCKWKRPTRTWHQQIGHIGM